MQRICPWLFVGSYRDTLDSNLMAAQRIGALLHLVAPVTPPGIVTQYLPIEDGAPLDAATLYIGVQFVLDQHVAGQRVLVACGAGISRSTTFAIAALRAAEGLTLREAALHMRQAHPAGLPHPVLWASLCAFANEPLPYLDLVRMGEA
jgi:protein-tyrosine phosphatase